MIPVHMSPGLLQRAGKQFILCGDPQQLPAVTQFAENSESILGYLMRHGVPRVLLQVKTT